MRYLTLPEVLELQRRLIDEFGGAEGIREMSSLESSLIQPQMTLAGADLYATIESKALRYDASTA